MLLNLTNHPSSTWSQAQKDAAIKQFGGILDMPFPQIDPEASLEEVQALAIETFEKIAGMKISELAVLVTGEFNFCYCILTILERERVAAYATTSERIASVSEKGERIPIYLFKQFRPYFK